METGRLGNLAFLVVPATGSWNPTLDLGVGDWRGDVFHLVNDLSG